ncbi:hypothetical protein VTP01DRAFT_2885 [Rhizomucor pusillus]|uniref:uncharacterized protein n=1 Tax=Rhizomucor pusillus TaxID=4840 RepID=UPI0037439730
MQRQNSTIGKTGVATLKRTLTTSSSSVSFTKQGRLIKKQGCGQQKPYNYQPQTCSFCRSLSQHPEHALVDPHPEAMDMTAKCPKGRQENRLNGSRQPSKPGDTGSRWRPTTIWHCTVRNRPGATMASRTCPDNDIGRRAASRTSVDVQPTAQNVASSYLQHNMQSRHQCSKKYLPVYQKNLLHQVFQIQEILDTLNLLDGRAIGLYREFESANEAS